MKATLMESPYQPEQLALRLRDAVVIERITRAPDDPIEMGAG